MNLYDYYALNEIVKNQIHTITEFYSSFLENMPFKEWNALNRIINNITKNRKQPDFNLGVAEYTVVDKPFCELLRFGEYKNDKPNVLFVAPLSGHYATLLRGSVKEFLDYNVYITNWRNANEVPLDNGIFSLDEYISYVMDYVREFKGDVHIISICQSGVPVIAALSLLAENENINVKSLSIMGAPIDTRISPTAVNKYADEHDLQWFKDNVISQVSFNYPGSGRNVYPGFLQLTGFILMNLEKHKQAYSDYFTSAFNGEEEKVEKHERFYDEYLSVLDMDAAFYLDTIEKVFKEHQLPEGVFTSHNQLVKPSQISKTLFLTVEGEKDDICGLGQTECAHKFLSNVPYHKHIIVEGSGHYGIFSGSHYRNVVAPEIKKLIKLAEK
jgi:poly(3-hydroxybutyrate) depolymerase